MYGYDVPQAREEIQRFIKAFKNATASYGGVKLKGFLESYIKLLPARTVKNPKTQETFISEPKEFIKVVECDTFKRLIQTGNYEENY